MEILPRRSSRRWIEYLWVCTTPIASNRPAPHRVVADPGVSLAFTCRRRNGRVEGASLRLMGPVESQRKFEGEPGFEMVCVRPKLEWVSHLLKALPRDHVDAKDDYFEVDPRMARPILDRLCRARSTGEALRTLEGMVARLAERASSSPDVRVLRAMHFLRDSSGTVAIRDLAQRLDCSPRTLRRWVGEASGMTPKRYARLLRFQSVLAAADHQAKPEWAALACDFGYFDQSHLIRDFQEFAWSPPAVVHHERRRESAFSNPL